MNREHTIVQTLSASYTKLFTNTERASLMYVLEKKLVSAIGELIDEVIEVYPNFERDELRGTETELPYVYLGCKDTYDPSEHLARRNPTPGSQ